MPLAFEGKLSDLKAPILARNEGGKWGGENEGILKTEVIR